MDEYGLRPVFFKWIATGTQLNGGIHGGAPVICKHESDSFSLFDEGGLPRYQSRSRSAGKKTGA
jgi:hypothetical protein